MTMVVEIISFGQLVKASLILNFGSIRLVSSIAIVVILHHPSVITELLLTIAILFLLCFDLI